MSKNNQDGPMTHELEEILTFDPTSVTIDGVRRQSDEFHPRFVNSGSSLEKAPSSVVQTGV